MQVNRENMLVVPHPVLTSTRAYAKDKQGRREGDVSPPQFFKIGEVISKIREIPILSGKTRQTKILFTCYRKFVCITPRKSENTRTHGRRNWKDEVLCLSTKISIWLLVFTFHPKKDVPCPSPGELWCRRHFLLRKRIHIIEAPVGITWSLFGVKPDTDTHKR